MLNHIIAVPSIATKNTNWCIFKKTSIQRSRLIKHQIHFHGLPAKHSSKIATSSRKTPTIHS